MLTYDCAPACNGRMTAHKSGLLRHIKSTIGTNSKDGAGLKGTHRTLFVHRERVPRFIATSVDDKSASKVIYAILAISVLH
jgi:hypothetical protein